MVCLVSLHVPPNLAAKTLALVEGDGAGNYRKTCARWKRPHPQPLLSPVPPRPGVARRAGEPWTAPCSGSEGQRWQSHLSGWCRSRAPWRNDPSAELLHTLNPRSFSPSQDGGAGSGARGGAHPVSARPSSHSSAPPFAARRPAPSPGPARYSNPECVFLQMIKSIQS